MPVDAGGNATRPPSPIPVTGQNADAPQVNVPINDIYAILNMLLFADGRKPLRGNIPMNGHRATGAADAQGPQDYVTLAQIPALLAAQAVLYTTQTLTPEQQQLARDNVGIGNSATLNVGTTSGTVAAGDDGRITGALQESNVVSQVEAEAGTATTARAWTAQRVAQAVASQASGLGIGQTWQDVSGSRVSNTSYQNTTDKPIYVTIAATSGTRRDIQVSPDGASGWVNVGSTTGSGTGVVLSSFVVPAGHYYRINGSGSFSIWSELR